MVIVPLAWDDVGDYGSRINSVSACQRMRPQHRACGDVRTVVIFIHMQIRWSPQSPLSVRIIMKTENVTISIGSNSSGI